MIPRIYVSYFETASQASGALIGLLIVVVALRPTKIVGAHADPVARGLAASSFTGLVDAFFVSLLALIPGRNLGIGAAILAVISLGHTLRLHLGRSRTRHIVVFFASLLAYGFQLYVGIAFAFRPHDSTLVNDLSFVIIGAFAVALSRAWQLLQSGVVAQDQTQSADSQGDEPRGK